MGSCCSRRGDAKVGEGAEAQGPDGKSHKNHKPVPKAHEYKDEHHTKTREDDETSGRNHAGKDEIPNAKAKAGPVTSLPRGLSGLLHSAKMKMKKPEKK
jgi:hypothetical protein